MIYAVPDYDFVHNSPIVGFGNFTKTFQGNAAYCMIDRFILQKKFDLWNDVIKSKILTKNFKDKNGRITNKKEYIKQLKARLLLKDKAIFAYANFKFDNKPFKLRFFQDVLLSDDYDKILFAASNQIGKSIALDADAAIQFLKDHEKNWVGILVSKSLDQSQYQMDRIKSLLKSANIDYREESTVDKNTGKKDNTVKISYTFYKDDGRTPKYTNLLICSPPTGSALGYPCDDMWLDEFDFWENVDQHRFIFQIAIPRTFETKGRIKIFTNPDGKGKMLYHLWNLKDAQGNYVWHRYNFNYWDKPLANQEEFDKNSTGMTKQQIESTLLAVFSTSARTFFTPDEVMKQIDNNLNDASGYSRETAWFLDVGGVHDQHSLGGAFIEENPDNEDMPVIKTFWLHKYPVGYPISRCIGIETKEWETDGWGDYEEDNPSIKDILKQYAIVIDGKSYQPLFGFDVTGNSGLVPLFSKADIDAEDVTFSGPRKWHMFTRYKAWTQQGWFKRAIDRDDNTVGGRDASSQAMKLIEKKAKGRNYGTIHHENEDDLDDTQDTFAGLIYLIDNPDFPGLSFDIINNGVSVLKDIDEEKESIKKKEVLEEQYIPSFVNKQELGNWMKERELH